MEKFKSAFAKFTPGTQSKLYKGMGNPFLDGPSLEEPTISKPTMYLLITSIFFTFLSICCMGAVAGFQSKWVGVSGLTGFSMFVTIVSFLLATMLLATPLIYDRYDKLKKMAAFLREQGALFIFHGLGTGLMLIMAFAVTISAWTQKGCKSADSDPHADLGDDFKNGLSGWCRTKKAAAMFMWFSFMAWLGILILTFLKWRRSRKTGPRDEPFIPPSSSTQLSRAPSTFKSTLPQSDPEPADEAPVDYGYSRPNAGYDPAMGGRASVDPYGAFGGDSMPQAAPTPGPYDRPAMPKKEPSRTMQLAYDDPYANVRAALSTPAPPSATGYSQPQQYQHGGLPAPPDYSGYR